MPKTSCWTWGPSSPQQVILSRWMLDVFPLFPKLTCFIFSQGQICMGKKARKNSWGQNQRVNLLAVENERTCEPMFEARVEQEDSAWKEIAPGKSLQALESCPVSAFYLIYNVLWRLPWLCQMGFSVFPCWSCQFFMLHKCRFVFWSEAGDSWAEEPRCDSREQSLPRLMPCSTFGWELFHTAALG